ncbi:MAG: hypothetical protein QXS85_02090 [Acidilobaceae archaeon]
MRRVLLLLPCNKCVRLGDYALCDSWRRVLASVGDLVSAGLLELAAIDSCKPGVVVYGEELSYSWCDIEPYWGRTYGGDGSRFEILVDAIARDLRELSLEYRAIVAYLNVKAYKLAVLEASRRTGVTVFDLSPPRMSPLSFRSRRSLERLRASLLELVSLHSDA